jgi:ethanolamine-phosphate phospho-lyase
MSCGGLRPFPKGYLKDVYQYVREAGGLCIADEVQVGFGRAGKCFWMFEDQDVIPDVVTMGKPMGNGHPVSAAVTTRAIAEKFKANSPSCYFNTYGGNPVSMAVANAVLNVIEEDKLQEHARAVGEYVFSKFEDLQKKYPNVIGFVHHCGLFGGIDLIKDCESCAPNTELAQHMHLRLKEKHHIIMTTDGLHDNVMKFKPPMVFDWKDADYLVECFDESLKALTAPPAPPAVNKEVLMTGRPTCSDPPAVAVSCLPVVKT